MARAHFWAHCKRLVANSDQLADPFVLVYRTGQISAVARASRGPLVNLVRRRIDRGHGHPVADRDIFINIFMPTTVHIPDPLLKSVDRRAKALGISRNRLVVRALEQAISVRSGWAPEFLQRLRHVDRDTSAAVDELLIAVTQARRSKEPRDL